MAKLLFDATVLESFCSSTMQNYLKLSAKALSILVPFVTTNCCKSGFSSIPQVKKNQNRLNP